MKKVCSILSSVIIIVLAVLAILMLGPRVLGYKTLAVLTGSMEPKYHVGSLIYVKELDASEYKIGDVVTYQLDGGTVVTHRIVEINSTDGTVTTKGDANEDNDGAIQLSQIVGKAYWSVPLLGFIAIYAKTPIGILAICGVMVVIILLNFLPEIFSKEEDLSGKKLKEEK